MCVYVKSFTCGYDVGTGYSSLQVLYSFSVLTEFGISEDFDFCFTGPSGCVSVAL